MTKRFVILFVIFSMCFCSLAFADDLEPGSTGSSPSAIDVEYDKELYALANTLYKIETDNGTKAASRTIDDIYNLLVQIFYNQSNGTNEIVVMRQFLNTINTSANGIAVKLTQFYDTINPDYDITGISIYDELNALVTALTTIDPNDGDLTIIETLVYITNALDDLHTDLSTILNSTYSIDNKLVSINTAIVQFKSDLISSISTLNSDLNTGFTNVNANMSLILSKLQDIRNDYNNISWTNLTSFLGVTTVDDVNTYINPNQLLSIGDYYVFYSSPGQQLYPLVRFVIPFRVFDPSAIIPSFDVIGIYNTSNNNLYNLPYQDLYFTPFATGYYLYANQFVSFSSSSNYRLAIKIHISRNNTYYYSYSGSCSYLPIDSQDLSIFYNYLVNTNINSNLTKLTHLYASDDLIQSKEEQQPLENQIIEDFTGNGSASATVGDAVNVKQASNAIKNGLNTGANSGVALDYAFGFNNPSGLFVWFSSDTAQYFTLYQPTRGVSDYNSIEWTDELPDHLSILDYKYLQGLDND